MTQDIAGLCDDLDDPVNGSNVLEEIKEVCDQCWPKSSMRLVRGEWFWKLLEGRIQCAIDRARQKAASTIKRLQAELEAAHKLVNANGALLNASQDRVAKLEDALSTCDWKGERAHWDDEVDPFVEHLCDQVGYGRVMDAAARLWFRKSGDQAFTVGPTGWVIRNALEQKS